MIAWNASVKLILADVDQTVADDFLPAEPAMVDELTALLKQEVALFFLTGGPLSRLRERLIDRLPAELRHRIIVGHCMGAEVWGFDRNGQQRTEPFYSLYDKIVTDEQKVRWRQIVEQLIAEFKFETHPPQPVELFREQYGDNPLAVILEDRGPQITFEIINGYQMNETQHHQAKAALPELEEVIDLREPLYRRAEALLRAENIPVGPHFGGTFALDLILKGVSKTAAIQEVFRRPDILSSLGLTSEGVQHPEYLEIWGDRFDKTKGSDWQMCEAVDGRVRAVDFRADENPASFPSDASIVFWDGQHQLHAGTLEYLQSRH